MSNQDMSFVESQRELSSNNSHVYGRVDTGSMMVDNMDGSKQIDIHYGDAQAECAVMSLHNIEHMDCGEGKNLTI
jgi:hypothetical protein